ncbi:DUF6759 domain-containing protein [uncultured Chryseobacterium sp.]|uniref:DUF6759 domain-containing protein n=1 Tax=uncultured Chryseobacterium sp. TaxID=259322 RepID=UPI0025E1AEB5|nr:DUF6759 domain-containing protein [uncultured Chryseobacterium sp.]
MKKLILIIPVCFFLVSCKVNSPEYGFQNILDSKNIPEIERFLRTCHPDDPKRNVLKSKLIALKNSEWMKGSKNARPMEARPVISEIPGHLLKNSSSAEAEEFKRLIASTAKEHSEKTVRLLNAMFNEDISSKEVILLLRNDSDCNMIVRIQGKNFYNLAVPARNENFMVINKGNYILTSNVCDMVYSSKKEISKSLFLTINNPIVTGNKILP